MGPTTQPAQRGSVPSPLPPAIGQWPWTADLPDCSVPWPSERLRSGARDACPGRMGAALPSRVTLRLVSWRSASPRPNRASREPGHRQAARGVEAEVAPFELGAHAPDELQSSEPAAASLLLCRENAEQPTVALACEQRHASARLERRDARFATRAVAGAGGRLLASNRRASARLGPRLTMRRYRFPIQERQHR